MRQAGCGGWWRRAAGRLGAVVVALLLVAGQAGAVATAGAAPAPAAPARAPQAAFRVEALSAKPDFPTKITFGLTVESDTADIVAAKLFYRPVQSEVANLSVAEVRPARRLTLSHAVDMRARYLPPGLDIQYYWSLTDAAGNQFDTPPQTFLYQDDRFTWRTLTGGQITVFYYSGNDDFGRDLLDTALRATERLSKRFGVTGSQPIHIVVYGNNRDFSTSLPPNSAEWIGGQAHPDLGLIVTGIQPGGGAAAEIRRVLPHEVSHLLLYQATENPYGAPPHWLDEGLAVYNQETPDSSLKPLFDRALREGTLIPTRALNSNFPLDPNQARLSYAESLSLVEYLVGKYGDAKLGELLLSFKAELSYDEALKQTFGLTTDELDRDWKASLGYQGDKPGGNIGGGDAGGAASLRDGGATPLVEAALPFLGLGIILAGGLLLRRRRPATPDHA